ncbi:MAG TPA: hypothetical protein VFZ61_31890 [Polyangiales bacterium]
MTLAGLCALWGCDDDKGTEADRLGVGAECRSSDDCLQQGDGGVNLTCLTQFKGGYCGLQGCSGNDDCPDQSACVLHDDGNRYCFRSCSDKPECNANRSPANESNCSSNVSYVDDDTRGKACVPPSG